MSAAYTPGPWAAKPSMLRAVCITSASGPVATTSSASHVSREINIANARLIAAAPELLAALQAIMAGVAGCQREPHWEAARAAIIRASAP